MRQHIFLYWSFARVSLFRELMFRGNFLLRVVTHLVWFASMLAFFDVIFMQTERIGDWDRYRYLIFLGTFLVINGTVNALFIGNCVELGELIRTGNLDFTLLVPIDEQFIVTCRRIDWALMPQVMFGLGMVGLGVKGAQLPIDALRVLLYLALVLQVVAILYALLLILASVGFWIVQHRELFELWFLLLQFANYPDEIYGRRSRAAVVGPIFSSVMPLVLAINVPAKY